MPMVLRFKVALVKAFSDARKQLASRPGILLPDFTDPAAAARAWLASYEENQQRLDNLRPTTSLLAGISENSERKGRSW